MKHANKISGRAWQIRTTALLLATAAVLTQAGEHGPEELRGKVTGVAGDRIHIELDQKDWLPRTRGTKVSLGAEMAGMFVPLKGHFNVIQVNADSVVAMAVGGGEHGKPAAGMLAVIRTPYPDQPQRRADYVSSTNPEVLSMAERGDPLAQHLLAMGREMVGDHDNALRWWQQAVRANAPASVIAHGARGIANILVNRGDARSAVAVLKDALPRTKPRADEKTFDSYCAAFTSTVDLHRMLLEELGAIHRVELNDLQESVGWYRASADLLAAVVSNGAPATDHPNHGKYISTLNELSNMHRVYLQDPDAALTWLKAAARHGDDGARKKLTEKGLSW